MCSAFLAILALATAGLPSPGEPDSHTAWIDAIRASDFRGREEAVAAFDAWSRSHPRDVASAIERCKLIAAWTGEEEAAPDPRLPTENDCLKGLERDFPASPAAVTYRLDHSWGQTALSMGEHALQDSRIPWTDAERAHLQAKIARVQQSLGQPGPAAETARRAMALDPSIDLTAIVATQLLAQDRRREAVVVLSSRTSGTWFEVQQKARHLSTAGAFFRAQWMLSLAHALPGYRPDAMLQARIYEGTGKPRLARETYAKQRGTWRNADLLLRLFRLELSSGDRDGAVRAYQDLRDQGWKADPIARHRLALARKVPSARIRARDVVGLGALAGGLLLLALLPALCILPLHAWTLWRRLQLPRPTEAAPRGEWWFRHAYVAAALFVIAQALALYVFDYDELASWWSRSTPDPHAAGNGAATFAMGYAIGIAVLFGLLLAHRPERVRLLGPGSWTLGKCVRQAALSLIVAYAAGFLGNLLAGRLKAPAAVITPEQMVESLTNVYGIGFSLLAVAVLIPIVEEVLFRSVLLDVFARHSRFWVANLLQAVVFAALHAEPVRLIFYTVLGLLSGRMRRASGGLLASILFHAANNGIAVLAVLALSTGAIPRPDKLPPPPDRDLLACARARGDPLRSTALALSLNNLAWTIAIDASSTPACLRKAEEAVGAALAQVPDNSAFLDTEATVLFRLGRLDEAIDLERAATDVAGHGALQFSQLERFLRARQSGDGPLLLGGAQPVATVTIDPAGNLLVVDPGASFPDGVTLYARETRTRGLLQVATGPGHEKAYRLALPKDVPAGAKFAVALVDARGCEDCAASGWRWRYERHDDAVDKLP